MRFGRRALAIGICGSLALAFVASPGVHAPNAGATTGPRVHLETESEIRPGAALHARVVVDGASRVGALQFTLAFDRRAATLDGIDVPTGRRGLNAVEHATGVTAGFFAPVGARMSDRLETDVVLVPAAVGHVDLSLQSVTVTDAQGRSLPFELDARAAVRIGAGGTNWDAPAGRPSAAARQLGADAVLTPEAAQAEWTLATEQGECATDECVTVADVQQIAAAVDTTPVDAIPALARSFSGPTVDYVVDTTSDANDSNIGNGVCAISGGGCSLRAAIQESNLSVDPVNISFAIPGGGVKTLSPATRYPILSNVNAPVTIDGFTQAGASANTDPLGSNAVYMIEIEGQGPNNIDAFLVTGANITFRGLNIHGFGRHIWMLGAAATNNTIAGSLIGLLPNGATDPLVTLAIGKSCVVIQGGAHDNHVGVPGDANRNVVSGCPHQNIATYDNGTDYNVIQNNIIGLSPDGTGRRGAKSHGIDINTWSSHTLIGGSNAGERNVSSGNSGNGIEISHGIGTMYNQVIGNFIGSTLDGNSVTASTVNGQIGVRLEGNPTCATTCDPDISYQSVINNVIVNSGEGGVFIDKGTHHSLVQGNKIGVTNNGGDGRNTLLGIRVEAGAYNTTITQNEIANNDAGIQIVPTGASPPNATPSPTPFNTISQNSIHDNGVGAVAALGIDLAPLGAVNTAGNADANVNEAMIAPTLSNPMPAAVDATTCAGCTVELFLADRPVNSFGSGSIYLASGVADASGAVRLFVPAIAQGAAVTATATNLAGSTSEFSRNVGIPLPNGSNTPPTAVASATCSHLSCTYSSAGSADPGGSIVRYVWNFGDGATAEGASASHTYSVGGSFNVTLTVTDNDAATATANTTAVAVNLDPTASFTGSCSFQLCSLNASASTDPDGPIASYAWNFGDGSVGTGVMTTHSFAASGTYTITLVVDDGNGATSATSQQFTVTALPPGTLGFDVFSRTLTNTWGTADVGGAWSLSSAPSDYGVSGGVGRISTSSAGASRFAYLANTSVVDSDTVVDIATDKTPTGGTYGEVAGQTARRLGSSLEYRLRLRFPVGGGVKLSIAKVVNSSTEVQIGSEINVAGATYAPGRFFTTRFRVTGVNPTTLQAKAWTTGTAEPATWGITATDSQAELQVAGAHGMRAYLSGSATNAPVAFSVDNYRMQVVNTLPTAAFSASCVNSLCTFNGSASTDPDGTIQSYSWDFGDGTTGTGVVTNHDYGSAFGSYVPTLTVTDNYSGTATTAQSLNVLNAMPVASFSASCVDLTCTFDASASVDPDGTLVSYDWDFGDGAGATGVSTVHTFADAGVYTFVLQVGDDDGATDASSQTVTVLGPNAAPTATYTVQCVLLTCDFDATASSDPDGTIQGYLWDFGDGTTAVGPTPQHTFGYTNDWTVQLTVTDDRGGTDIETQTLAVVGPNLPPVAAATVQCSAMACSYDAAASSDVDGTVVSYQWAFGDGSTASGATANHTYALAGTWPVTLTVTDDDSATAVVVKTAVVAPTPPVLVTASDTFTRTVNSGWGTANTGGTWTTSGSANSYNVNGSLGTQRVTGANGSTSAYLNSTVGSDLDVQVRVATDKAASGAGHWTNLTVRRVTATNEYRVRVKTTSSGLFLAAAKLAGSSSSTLIGAEIATGLPYTPNQFYRVRAQAIGTNPTTIRAKVWVDGTAEPATWALVRTDSTAAIQAPGTVGVSTFVSGTIGPVVWSFDDFVVGPANNPPNATFTTNCNAMTCNMDASASTDDGSISLYAWTFGDGGIGVGSTTQRTYAASGTYTVTLSVWDDQGLLSVTTRTVVVNAPPTSNFTFTCTNHDCNFDASGSNDSDGSIVSYAWDFGDSTTGTGVTPGHTYGAAGTYTVALTVTDNQGATATTSALVAVNTAPTAAFTPDCAAYSCSFDAAASVDPDGTIQQYEWDFGDTNTAFGPNPSHDYSAAGTYTVQLTVTDDLGATHATSMNVLADVAPLAFFSSDCVMLQCAFDASTSVDIDGTIALYEWNFGDGTTATGIAPDHTFATGGNHDVTLTVTDDLGATGVRMNTVSTNAAPTAEFTVVCTDYVCSFAGGVSVDPDGSIITYAWDFGDDQTDTVSDPNHTYGTAGAYTVSLTVTDDLGATNTVTHTVVANVAPVSGFTETCTLLTCDFDGASSTDSDGSIVSYAWNFGDGQTSTAAAPQHAFANGGSYSVSLMVTDNLGGTHVSNHVVTVNAAPVAAFTPNCTLLSCTFDANASVDPDGSITSYAWNFGDANAATGVTTGHTYALAGEWPVTLTVTDNGGETATMTALVFVAPAPLPTVFAQDSFTRTTTNGWGTADLGGAWTTSGTSSNYGVNSGVAKMTQTSASTSNAARLSGISGTDLDVQARVSVDKTQTGSGSWVNIVGRYVGTNLEYRARIRFGSSLVYAGAYRLNGGAAQLIGSEVSTGLAMIPNTFYRVRMNVSGTNPTTIRIKVWADNGTEPTAWLVTQTDSSAALQVAGNPGFQGFAGNATSYPAVFSIDDLVVRPANMPPVAAFIWTCDATHTCNVDASASSDDGSIVSYEWVWGDGTTTTGSTSAHTFASAGTRNVTLTLTDNQGAKTVLTQTVTVT